MIGGLTFDQEQRYRYDLYLLSRLALDMGYIDAYARKHIDNYDDRTAEYNSLEYDEEFPIVINLYEEFYSVEMRDFNDESKSLYDCYVEFLQFKKSQI